MNRGVMSLKRINELYHEIRRKSQNLILYERSFDVDGIHLLLNVRDGCYTYTCETIDYTITHSEQFKWFSLRK